MQRRAKTKEFLGQIFFETCLVQGKTALTYTYISFFHGASYQANFIKHERNGR